MAMLNEPFSVETFTRGPREKLYYTKMSWERIFDKETNLYFYWKSATNESTWDKPEEFDEQEEAEESYSQDNDQQDEIPSTSNTDIAEASHLDLDREQDIHLEKGGHHREPTSSSDLLSTALGHAKSKPAFLVYGLLVFVLIMFFIVKKFKASKKPKTAIVDEEVFKN